MNSTEWLVLGGGILLLMAGGAWHLAGILLIKRVTPKASNRPLLGVLLTFWGLLFLHLSEIAASAFIYALVLSLPETGSIARGYGDTIAGLLYFSGINYATLGYTQQVAHGPLRLLAMLQALGGFMLITWSATLVYSVWADQFRDSGKQADG